MSNTKDVALGQQEKTVWRVDFYFTFPNGTSRRFKKGSPINTMRGAQQSERERRCQPDMTEIPTGGVAISAWWNISVPATVHVQMRIQIKTHAVKVTKALRAHIELRLGFALSRFGEHIGRVTVDLSNSEEHHSRADKRCKITVDLQRSVKVQETDADLFEAVARAAARVSRSVAFAIKREAERSETLSPSLIAKKRKPRAAPLRSAKQEAEKTRPSRLKRKSPSVPVRK